MKKAVHGLTSIMLSAMILSAMTIGVFAEETAQSANVIKSAETSIINILEFFTEKMKADDAVFGALFGKNNEYYLEYVGTSKGFYDGTGKKYTLKNISGERLRHILIDEVCEAAESTGLEIARIEVSVDDREYPAIVFWENGEPKTDETEWIFTPMLEDILDEFFNLNPDKAFEIVIFEK
jgi:hypothetical protein